MLEKGLLVVYCFVCYFHDGGFVRIAYEYDGAVVVFTEVFGFVFAFIQ